MLHFLINICLLTVFNPVDAILDNSHQGGFDATLAIGIHVDVSSVVIEGDASVESLDGKVVSSIQGNYRYTVRQGRIQQQKKLLSEKQVILRPKLGILQVNGHIFRGSIKLVVQKGKLTVINILPIEEYVRGVINREALPGWPLEAKKTQAILARTFAVYKKINHPRSKLYDLAPSVIDQVYGGLEREDVSSNQAVDQTKGIVIIKDNMPAKIYFHSTCGGKTASAKEVWGKEVSYLHAVKCPYCKNSSLYRWKRSYDRSVIAKRLNKAGYSVGKIKKISVQRGKNRVKFVVVNRKKIPVNKFRAAVGYTAIWSNDFSVSLRRGKISFSGKGAGHGVGVCQYGMAGMAKKGKSYKQILRYYLEGTELRRLY